MSKHEEHELDLSIKLRSNDRKKLSELVNLIVTTLKDGEENKTYLSSINMHIYDVGDE